MSLRDSACYALTLVPSLKDPTLLELVENYGPNQVMRYGRVREPNRDGEVYSAALYDAFSGAKLASTGMVNEKLRSRRLELHGPDERVPFEFTGKLGFEWSFEFEGNKYRWKRDGGIASKDMVCIMDRRPDPNIDVALGRAGSRDKPAKLTILHYNIERFMPSEIKDLRGLETLFALSFVSLTDGADIAATSRASSSSSQSAQVQNKPLPPGPASNGVTTPPEIYNEDANEVIVGVHTDLDGHIARAIGLLEDPNVLFIIIRTKDARAAQRALQVVLGVTRYRHRSGLPDLRQYVIEEEAEAPKGPKVIKLDDPNPKPSWKPPPNLAIYLSTIELPDLKRANTASKKTSAVAQAQARPASVGLGAPPPQHRPASPNPMAPPLPSTPRPVSPNPTPHAPANLPMWPNTHNAGMLNTSSAGPSRPNRPVSFSGSLAGAPPSSNSNFQPQQAQPNPTPQWGAPGFGGGYSESPFRHGLFKK